MRRRPRSKRSARPRNSGPISAVGKGRRRASADVLGASPADSVRRGTPVASGALARYFAATKRWLDAHPDDPDGPAFAARIRAWHDAYLRWAGQRLDLGFCTLLEP